MPPPVSPDATQHTRTVRTDTCHHHAHSADVAHELRTPLTAIRGALQLIHSEMLGHLTEPVARMVAVALTNSERLLRLIDDMLIPDAYATGQLPMQWETVNLGELMQDAVESNACLFFDRDRDRDRDRDYGSASDVPTGRFIVAATQTNALIRADRGRLLQILTNLLSNAIKFSPKDTAVTLALHQIGTFYRITVTDQGAGIPKTFQPLVFQRFTRGQQAGANIPGSGLGLNIAQSIAAQHGGIIHFECPAHNDPANPNSGGTHFHVDLPMITPGTSSSKI